MTLSHSLPMEDSDEFVDDAVVVDSRVWDIVMSRIKRLPKPRLIIETPWRSDNWVRRQFMEHGASSTSGL